MRDPDDPFKASGATRKLGLVICRGVQVCLITPVDGTEEIANPFVAGDGGSDRARVVAEMVLCRRFAPLFGAVHKRVPYEADPPRSFFSAGSKASSPNPLQSVTRKEGQLEAEQRGVVGFTLLGINKCSHVGRCSSAPPRH